MVTKFKSELNNFFKTIKLKKQYVQNLKNKNLFLTKIIEINYKYLNSLLLKNQKLLITNNDYLITHIININFSKSNSFLHVMNYAGNLNFFYSAGSFDFAGKNKKSRYNVFKDFYKVLVSKLKFLKGKPIALHFKNVGFNKSWIVKKLKKRFFIKCVQNFTSYPYNGCRKPKTRRLKHKKVKV